MTKREQLQAEIIEKQKEIDKAKDVVIEHYKNCMRKLTLYSPETIGYQEGVIKNIKSELSALTTALEKEGEEKMKIVYIAHPISGDIGGNLNKVVQIGRMINITYDNVVPLSQFYFDCHCLDDTIPEERTRGIKNDTAILKSGIIDEVWLFGDRVSNGMQAEILLAKSLNIPIIGMTKETKEYLI